MATPKTTHSRKTSLKPKKKKRVSPVGRILGTQGLHQHRHHPRDVQNTDVQHTRAPQANPATGPSNSETGAALKLPKMTPASEPAATPGLVRQGMQIGMNAISGIVGTVMASWNSVRSEVDGAIPRESILDVLSELLAIEQGGAQLYAAARDRALDPEIRAKIEHFLDQSQDQAHLIENTIRALGGSPSGFVYLSNPRVRLQLARADSMQNLPVSAELRQSVDIENLMLAENQGLRARERLKSTLPLIADRNTKALVRELLQGFTEKTELNEAWARQILDKLTLQLLGRSRPIPSRSDATAA